MSALALEGIEKVFPNGAVALAGIDLEVSNRELVVLLGPSGCGKSTLLRLIAGIETPTRGRILLAGRDVTEQPPQRRDIAMVFQSYALYPHMSVRQNLAFGLQMRGLPRAEVAERVQEVAESLGLETLLERRPSQLSGGQRQRVALGRAIARRAKVFLLDEPLSNLDVQLRVNTRMELARLHQRLEAPMIYVTHDQEEAMTLADRVAVMRDGKVLQIGSPMEIYSRPAAAFVAGFVGSPRMNFLPATLAGDAGRPVIELLGRTIELTGASPAPVARSRAVSVGVRPEDIEVLGLAEDGGAVASTAGAGHPDADLTAQIELVEPLGREQLLHLVLEPLPDRTRPELRLLSDPATPWRSGDRVALRLRRDRLHFFDPESGVRLS